MVNYLVYYCLKNIPKIVLRLYFDSYMRQKACVSGDNIMSNGVKQGWCDFLIFLVFSL